MPLEDMNKDINTSFEKLKITSEENEDTIIEQGDYSHFTLLILSPINDIREKKKCPDTSSIYDYIMKTQASNADKALIDSVIVKLTPEGKIINKKTLQGLDSFYNSTKEIDNIQYDHSRNQLQSTNSSFLKETAPSIDKNLQTPICESSITNSVASNFEIPSNNPTFKKTLPISAPLNVNPIVIVPYNSRNLTKLRVNLMLSEVLLLVKYLI